jgi:hypothetical protein
MALMPVPSWLSVNPTDYLSAVKSGTEAGINIAQAQNRADEVANAAAARQWEFEQSLRQKALDTMAERERAAANLAATEKYREAQSFLGQQRLGETSRYHDLMAANAAKANELKAKQLEGEVAGEKLHYGPNGEVLLSKRDPTTGEWVVNQLRPGQKLAGLVSPSTAVQLLNSPYASLIDKQYGPGMTQKLRDIVNQGAASALGSPVAPPAVTPPLTPKTLPASAAAAGAPSAMAPAAPVPRVYIGPTAGEPGPVRANEEARRTKDGRTAIFDTRTKKFVRWAD